MPRSRMVLAGLGAVASLAIDGCYHSAKPSDLAFVRVAMRDLLANFFVANVAKALTLVPIELDVYGDVAYERGNMTWIGGPKGQASYPVQNLRYSVVRHRGADGEWRIHRLIETSPMPASR